jgi:hypothetical protein
LRVKVARLDRGGRNYAEMDESGAVLSDAMLFVFWSFAGFAQISGNALEFHAASQSE